MERWSGRIALVTGASAGIGAGICRELVKHGMTVIGCARNVLQIQAISEEDTVKSSTGRLFAMKCDLTNESEIIAMFNDIRQKFGHLDVCINNAGLARDAPLLTGKTSDWKNMLDVNVLALSICTKESVKLMQEKGIKEGHIIHISSTGGHRIPPSMPSAHFYCGTKFMVRALTEGLRRELKEQDSKIRISSISPGMTETEFVHRMYKEDPGKNTAEFYKAFQCLQPSDVAKAVVYVLGAPPHVEVHDIIVRPYEQKT